VRLSRLAFPLLGVLASIPLTLAATAAPKSVTPTFQQYTSPVGVDMVTGHLPQQFVDAYKALKDAGAPVYGIWTQRGLGDDCGEPTLAVEKKTGRVLYQCGLQTLRISGFGKKGKATWTAVTPPVTGEHTSDPLLYQDPATGRVWVNQLVTTGCSTQAYTDDFGDSWTNSAVGCAVGVSFDHQTLGAGKPTALSTSPLYPNVLYYCTNDLLVLECGTSLDGGLTFGPTHPVAPPGDSCSPIVGHVKSAPDGTTYVMPSGCTDEGGKQGVFVTTDNALSWTKRSIPHSTKGDSGHPSLGIGSDGTVYAAYGSADNEDGGGRVHVSVSRNRGETWSTPQALGKELGVRVSRFPLAVAGDGDRAAVAFLGSKAAENPNRNKEFFGTWRLYVSYTFDRGRHWKTYVATPDPVQVGSVCTNGTACIRGPLSDRNLLDFNDMVVDERGRVLVAFADGCLKSKGCTTRDRLKKGAIVRQESGRSLYRAFD
jgi:hypothetical protein